MYRLCPRLGSAQVAFLPVVKRLFRFLFDSSSAEENREEVEIILRATLRESTTDAEFDAKLGEVLTAWENHQGEFRHLWFRKFLMDYARREDQGAGIRTVAEHVLEDLPRIYGQKPQR